jgi:hypothetical protein
MEVLDVIQFSFLSNFTQETDTCNYPNYEEDTRIVMQQCLDKGLKIVISILTFSEIMGIFKLKDLAKRSEILLNFASI